MSDYYKLVCAIEEDDLEKIKRLVEVKKVNVNAYEEIAVELKTKLAESEHKNKELEKKCQQIMGIIKGKNTEDDTEED